MSIQGLVWKLVMQAKPHQVVKPRVQIKFEYVFIWQTKHCELKNLAERFRENHPPLSSSYLSRNNAVFDKKCFHKKCCDNQTKVSNYKRSIFGCRLKLKSMCQICDQEKAPSIIFRVEVYLVFSHMLFYFFIPMTTFF